ncbi:nucleoside diphosphate kinase regulator [Dongia sp.]|uniref:nucleoside diphosphate kinase regulator n=1 Tax=Dongia sp. TaxID=1977262 RepID=UPI0035AF89E1
MSRHANPPAITISERDHERLSNLALANEHLPGVGDYLTRELERARIQPEHEIGQDVVVMGTTLEYRDDTTGIVRQVTLVYPEDQDIAAWKISVLTPIGAALIGLSAGQSITFRDRAGEERRLTVTKILSPTK